MNAWKKLYVPENLVERYTDNGVLIRFPKTHLKGWGFWYPSKLYRDGWLICKEDFAFKIKKLKSDNTDEIDYDEMSSIFKEMVDKFERHIPEKLNPQKTKALEELKDE